MKDIGLTLFATPKPFRSPIAELQDRAIRSWLTLGRTCEVILLGDDEGVAEAARGHGVRHLPDIERNEFGTPLLDSIFRNAEQAANGRLLCYINADIILMSDFLPAVRAIPFHRFLAIGRRTDLDPRYVPDISDPNWESALRGSVQAHGYLQTSTSIDYFLFSRGLFATMPPLALGRFYWDSWLPYTARVSGVDVIDITPDVCGVHQNHDYAHYAGGRRALWNGPEARRNLELVGGIDHLFSTTEANWTLSGGTLRRPPWTRERIRRSLQTYPVLHPQWRPAFRLARFGWRARRLPGRTVRTLLRTLSDRQDGVHNTVLRAQWFGNERLTALDRAEGGRRDRRSVSVRLRPARPPVPVGAYDEGGQGQSRSPYQAHPGRSHEAFLRPPTVVNSTGSLPPPAEGA